MRIKLIGVKWIDSVSRFNERKRERERGREWNNEERGDK